MPLPSNASPAALANVSLTRRLLLASYHFGPDCETGGLRWNALSQLLAADGWEIDVLAAARPGAAEPYVFCPGVRVTPILVPTAVGDAVDALGRLRRLATGMLRQTTRLAPVQRRSEHHLINQDRQEQENLTLYSRVMGNVGAAKRWSAWVGWSRRAVRVGVELALARTPSVIAVSSPPHPTQLAGVWLSRALKLPVLADMRDPWLFGELDEVQSKFVDRTLGSWAQSQMLTQGLRFVCNTQWSADALVRYAPRLKDKVVAIPNGSDAFPTVALPDTEFFRVSFIGWLYDFMDPEPVLAACARLKQRERLDALRVEFIGTADEWKGVSLQARARAHGLGDCFEHRRRVPRDEARRLQQRSAVNLVYDAIGPYRVPAKFYDLVQCRGDLLLLGTTPSALADAADQIGVRVCRRYVAEEMDAVLDRALARWRNRAYDSVLDSGKVFDRARTARKMDRELQRLAVASQQPVSKMNSANALRDPDNSAIFVGREATRNRP